MASAQVPDVHLEEMEETQNEGYQSEKAGHPGRQCGNSRLGYWRIAGSPVLKCSITNERLAAAGYFSIWGCYESLHLCG